MKGNARKIAFCGLAVASLSLGMLVMKWLPQIEIVTVLLFVYATYLGFVLTLIASIAFVFIEGILYGFFAAWWFSYLVYWPLVVCVGYFCKRMRFSQYGYAIAAALITLCFGFISTLLEHLMYGMPFWGRYIYGIVFFVVHVVGNFFIVFFTFAAIGKRLKKIDFQPPD